MKRETVFSGFVRVELVETPQGERTVVHTTNSVNVLIFEPESRRVILVRQPRASMISDDNPEGLFTETAAGRFDVALGPVALMIKEVHEETGITIAQEQLELLNDGEPLALSAGVMTEEAYLGIARIAPEQMPDTGRAYSAADEDERIRLVAATLDDLKGRPINDLRVFAIVQYLLRTLAERR